MTKRALQLLLLISLGLPTLAMNIQSSFQFEKFTYNQKLPSNSVNRTFHDSEGYLWFGTKDGLCRFDGYDIKVFRSSALTPGKLTSNEIQSITEDKKKRIWVGTNEGINILDKKSFTIRTLKNEYINKERVNALLTDSKGFIWVGTSNHGVIKINPDTEEYERFSTSTNSRLSLKGNSVSHLFEDKSGRIWISLWKNGLCFIDSVRNNIYYAPKIGSSDNPFRFFSDNEGQNWICTWGDGIFNLKIDDSKAMKVMPVKLSSDSNASIHEIVYSITQDNKHGHLWAVTFSGLVTLIKNKDGSLKAIDGTPYFEKSDTKLFHEIMKDRSGNLWLGSVGEGLFYINFNKLPINNFPLSEIHSQLNIPSYVVKFCQSKSDDDIFIVINRVGLFRFNTLTGATSRPANQALRSLRSINAISYIKSRDEFWIANEGEEIINIFKEKPDKELALVQLLSLSGEGTFNENTISYIFEDSKGNVWIGSSLGLHQKPVDGNIKLISSKIRYVNTISENKKGEILVGTEKEGMFALKLQTNNEYAISNIDLNIKDYKSFSIQSIYCRHNGEIYVGTKEGCIYFFDPKNQKITDISGQYSISDEGILDIIEDDMGFLWISTTKKIIRYNPETKAATYFSDSDGLIVTSFFKNAVIKLPSGEVMFGGNKGISAFNPLKLTPSSHVKVQHVAITDIQIQNKSIFDKEKNNYFDTKRNRLIVKHSENNIIIEFSALDYSSASKIQYAYMLSGVDADWNYVGNNRRFVNYANLPAGKYTFMVRASDENGLWSNQITSLLIDVKPPLYRSNLAFLLYFILLGAIAYFIIKELVHRIRLRNELTISQIEKQKTEELAQVKLRYFTNISHELLTPLTVIMLQIETLQKKHNNEVAQFEIMKDNVNRLKRLIKQILVFRKTESGNMKLKIAKNDIVAFVNNICNSSFKPQISEKGIRFNIDVQYDSYMAYFDPDKLDKVVYNLLSNALKHTESGGEIALKMSFVPRKEDIYMRLSVSDNGSGIPEEDLPHIFKRFYISKSADQSQSHGIGLSLTSDLLQLHKGNITVKSQLGEGTVFTIEIPVTITAYSQDEISTEDLPDETDVSEIVTSSVEKTDDEIPEQANYTLLVVEDNKELNKLILENFEGKYNVLSAENGLQALQLVKETDIDIVISDVMMPEMDGLTFCKIIKNDITTSHINILMLTAKNSVEDRIECYNAGADAYIAKPFELAVLNARVKNLLSNKKQKAENFKNNQEINISSMEYNSIDELFLKQAVSVVEERLDDEKFDFDQFAIDMATSKSTLHRKLKSLTGLSPGEFIRNIRLKHAVQMLSNNMGNVSEIAFAVGFNDPKYFSRCFKTEYGMTPKEFQEAQKNKKE